MNRWPASRLIRLKLHQRPPPTVCSIRWIHSSIVCPSPAMSADPSKIRNIALMAHIDSGKTTLTESILHTSSFLVAPGSVDTGSTTTDFLPAERERGITIQSASIPVKWKDWTFNLIDTPGHVDFGMEVESASRVIDGAVVLLDAVEGVEGQTRGVWRQLDRHAVPTRMIFMNKLDRPGASLNASLLSLLSHRLHPNPVMLTLPIASFDPHKYQTGEPGIEGIVDLVNWEVWRWYPPAEGISTFSPAEKITRTPLPITSEEDIASSPIFPPNHPVVPHLLQARSALIDNISVLSPELLDNFLELPSSPSPYLALPGSDIITALRALCVEGKVLPVLCGAALKHVGTELLMNYIGELLASPKDIAEREHMALVEAGKASTKKAIMKPGEVQMLAWKVTWDKRKGWMTFVRIYSGTLNRQSVLINTTNQQKERVSKLLLLYASQHEEVEVLSSGSVGVILGLKHTRTGDTLTSTTWDHKKSPSTLRPIVPPPSVISASVVPRSQADVQPVQEALAALSRTDPSLRVVEDVQEGQTLVQGLGALHLEIVEGRLTDEWGVKVKFGKRRVSYRENFGEQVGQNGEIVVDEFKWEKDMGGRHACAVLSMTVRAVREEDAHSDYDRRVMESWDGNLVQVVQEDGRMVSVPSSESPMFDHTQFPAATSHIPHILQGFVAALSSSPNTFLPLSHIHICVQSHSLTQGSPINIFAPAATAALQRAVREAGQGQIMEPYVRIKVDVGDEAVGKVVKDLNEHAGEILDLGSGIPTDDNEVGPYTSDVLYVPPKWITPASSSLAAFKASATVKRTIYAHAPLSRMLDYSSRLRAVSGGQATFEMSNEGFRAVSPLRKAEIMREIGRA